MAWLNGLDALDWSFIVITILWLGEFILFPSLEKEKKSQQKTFLIILATILFIILINGLMFYFDFLLIENGYLRLFALFIYLTGLILRYWSLILLGQNFSRNVEVKQDQELISGGPYKYVRHPLYTGLFLLTVAVPLYVGNLLIFFLAILLMYSVINRRIQEEESFMENELGRRYVQWKKDRYKLIPFII